METAIAADAPRGTPRRVAIAIRLLGAYHDGFIEFRYRDVARYRINLTPERDVPGTGHRDWRYDEFRLAHGGRVEHEIEWWGRGPTGTWLIEAANVEYSWHPFTTRAGESSHDVRLPDVHRAAGGPPGAPHSTLHHSCTSGEQRE